LLALKYKGSFWEILKLCPNEIGDLDQIWKLHKLRNKLVHELELPSVVELQKKSSDFHKSLKDLLSDV
jgi:hypothetical protein